jgi:hypothetical protein
MSNRVHRAFINVEPRAGLRSDDFMKRRTNPTETTTALLTTGRSTPAAQRRSTVDRSRIAVVLALMLIAGGVTGLSATQPAVAQTGLLDPTFGNGGTSNISTIDWQQGILGLSFPGGLAVGTRGPVVAGQRDGRVLGLTKEGNLDTGFGTNGVAELPVEFSAEEVFALTDGDLLIVGGVHFRWDATLVLTPTGHPEPAFNGGAPILVPQGRDWMISLASARPGGGFSLALVNTLEPAIQEVRAYLPSGALDPTFGSNGSLLIGYPTGDARAVVAFGADGSVFTQTMNPSLPTEIRKYGASGTVATSFGVNGVINIGPYRGDNNTSVTGTTDGGLAVVAAPTAASSPADAPLHRMLFSPSGANLSDTIVARNGAPACNLAFAFEEHVISRPGGGALFFGTALSNGQCNQPYAYVDAVRSDGQADASVGANARVTVDGQSVLFAAVDNTARLYLGGRNVVLDGPGQNLISRLVPMAAASFSPLVPGRLMDSRLSGVTTDGLFAGIGVRAAGTVTELQVAGRGGVPADASSVVLNVTVTGAQSAGFVTVWPCGAGLPNASNLNYVSGQTIPNAVITKIGSGGKVCFYTFAATDLIADVNGYYPK